MFVLDAALAGGESSWVFDGLRILAVPALVALNGVFVAAEFALVAIRRTKVEEMVSQGVKGAKALEHAVVHLDHSIAATQLGITLASIALGWVSEPAIVRLIEPLFKHLPGVWGTVASHSVAATLAFLVITFMHVVFGELLPKTMALQRPTGTALWLARPLTYFGLLSRPLIILMNGTANWLARLLGFRETGGAEHVHSVEELALLIEDTEEAGILDPDAADLLQNVFSLTNKKVSDCMVPRDKMATLDQGMSPEKVLEAVRSGAHTRMPVYEGNIDNVVGIVNTKDLFYLFSLQGVVVLQDALYPALYLSPDEEVANALRLFRKAKRHMALVRDDEDHIVGLITLEDILEEIVGDIEDEHDRPLPQRLRLRRMRSLQLPMTSAPARQPGPTKQQPT